VDISVSIRVYQRFTDPFGTTSARYPNFDLCFYPSF